MLWFSLVGTLCFKWKHQIRAYRVADIVLHLIIDYHWFNVDFQVYVIKQRSLICHQMIMNSLQALNYFGYICYCRHILGSSKWVRYNAVGLNGVIWPEQHFLSMSVSSRSKASVRSHNPKIYLNKSKTMIDGQSTADDTCTWHQDDDIRVLRGEGETD